MKLKNMKLKNRKRNLGKILKEARKNKKLSLDKFSEISKISKKYLNYLETNKFSKIPEVYLFSYLKKYSEILNLDYNKLSSFLSEILSLNKINKKDNNIDQQNKKIPKFIITPKFLVSMLMIIFFLMATFYFVYQIYNLFGLPTLNITKPSEDIVVVQFPYFKISGETDKNAIVKINGKEADLKENGRFKENLFLYKGFNIVKIEAINSRGRVNSITKIIIRK